MRSFLSGVTLLLEEKLSFMIKHFLKISLDLVFFSSSYTHSNTWILMKYNEKSQNII